MGVGLITAENVPKSFLSLDATALRTNPLQSFRDPNTLAQATILGKENTAIDLQTLAITLARLKNEAAAASVDSLTVTLLAPIFESGEAVAAAPCQDNFLTNLAKTDIFDGDSPTMRLVAFPLIGLSSTDRIDGTSLVPLSGQSGESLGGLYRCAGTAEEIEVFPFYIEHWRGPMDILPRYATALSDQLYRSLETLID